MALDAYPADIPAPRHGPRIEVRFQYVDPAPGFRFVAPLTLATLCLLWMIGSASTRQAAASPLLEMVGSPTNRHAFAARIVPSGISAVYFNPSLLVLQPPSVEGGVALVWQNLDIDLQPRPDGVDIFETIYDARQIDPNDGTRRLTYRPLPTARLRSERGSHDPGQVTAYGHFGVNTHILDGRLAFATYTLMPADVFQGQQPFFVDEREQYFSNSLHFELYEDRTRISIIAMGLAGKPVDWMALGAGVLMNTTSEANTALYIIDPTDQGVAHVNGQIDITTRLAPHAGIAITPWSTLILTSTLHFPQGNDVTGVGDMQFWDYDYEEGQHSVEQPFAFTHAYDPLRASLSASHSGGHQGGIGWLAAATVVWSRWSEYRDRHQERPSPPWSDTLSAAVAGELSMGKHRLALDLAYTPTPVPDQTGRSSYVDNDRLGASLGWDWRFAISETEWLVSAQMQLHRLFQRSADKSADADDPVFDEFPDSVDIRTDEVIDDSLGFQTNNPGYPGFASEGWILSWGLSATYLY